jgi:hypothetical protein
VTTHSRASRPVSANPAAAGDSLPAVTSGDDPVLALVDLAGTAATAYARPDLSERLGRLRAAITESPRVLVVGADQAARTELVTAMAGTLLPGHGRCYGRRWSPGKPDVPISGAEAGVVLIDTPDIERLARGEAAREMAALPAADAVLVLTPAAAELTAADLDLVRAAVARCPVVAVVVTQLERHPQWRQVCDRDRARLGAAGIEVALLAVSAGPAVASPDVGQGPGSGDPGGRGALCGFLLERVAEPSRRWRAGAATGEVLAVCEQLSARFRSEIAALEGPHDANQPQIADVRARAAAAQQGLARWQQTLSDGISDLVADIDHDLRERLRAVVTEAEQALDATDPAKTWDQFAAWLQAETTAAVATTFRWAEQRTAWLAAQVAAHFRAGPPLPGLPPTPPPALLTARARPAAPSTTPMTAPEYEKNGVGEAALTGLRGGYGGLLMVGLLSTAAGMALGTKTVADERRRGRRRRQAEAKAAVRRHVDDLLFQLGKDNRDRLRDVHRALRDHYALQAEQLTTALGASLEAAAAANDHREQGLADRRAELARLDALAEQATAIRALCG